MRCNSSICLFVIQFLSKKKNRWVNVLNQRDNKFGKNTEGETEKQRREYFKILNFKANPKIEIIIILQC